MKTIFVKIIFLSFCLIWFVSCNQDETVENADNNSSELIIKTGLSHMTKSLKSAPVSDFPQDSRLGLFITKGNLGDDYSSPDSRNVLSTLTWGVWEQNPAVNLYAHNATIFAYYPYNSAYLNGMEIPVQSDFTDYMYGTHTLGQAAINKDNQTVNLTMNHALSLIQFNIYKTNYPWEGRLTSVRIENASGKSIVHYSGKLNIQTGEITDLSGTDRGIQINSSLLLIIPEDKSEGQKDNVQLLLIPTAKTSSPGDVIVTFEIDGKKFNWEIPAGTQWEQGTKNIYDVLLNGNELRIGEVKIADWIDGPGGEALLE